MEIAYIYGYSQYDIYKLANTTVAFLIIVKYIGFIRNALYLSPVYMDFQI